MKKFKKVIAWSFIALLVIALSPILMACGIVWLIYKIIEWSFTIAFDLSFE